MALLLNIDTATETAVISIAENENVLSCVANGDQKDHASFLQPAIRELLEKNNKTIGEVNAIAVTAGPGSYTGLRVGMASAKGLCYALHIPLITLNTLEVMALSAINKTGDHSALYCPMIDARRSEVFAAIYDAALTEILKPCSMVLDINSFSEALKKNKIYFSGSGASKFKDMLHNENAAFTNDGITPDAMALLSYKKLIKNDFSDVAYSAPFYLKEFYTPVPGPKN